MTLKHRELFVGLTRDASHLDASSRASWRGRINSLSVGGPWLSRPPFTHQPRMRHDPVTAQFAMAVTGRCWGTIVCDSLTFFLFLMFPNAMPLLIVACNKTRAMGWR